MQRMDERWSRNCGSGGIGYSGGLNGPYRGGVLEANWVEEDAGRTFKATGRSTYGYGEPFRGNTTHRIEFNEMGKTGQELADAAQQSSAPRALSADTLFRHGSFSEPRMVSHASVNQLVHGPKQLGEPRVQTYLWTGSNTHNRTVPLSAPYLSLTQQRQQQWQKDHADPSTAFATTTHSALYSTALPAATLGMSTKRESLRPRTDTGMLSSVGRKPTGPHAEELNANFINKVGPRNLYLHLRSGGPK